MMNLRKHLLSVEGSVLEYVDQYLDLILEYPAQPEGTYTENHHFLPRCLFHHFKDEPWNIVALRGRDHLWAHYLLARAFPLNVPLANAYLMMICRDKVDPERTTTGRGLGQDPIEVPTEELLEQYEESRKLFVEHMRMQRTVRVKATGECIQIHKDEVDENIHESVFKGGTTYKDEETGEFKWLKVDHPDVTSGRVRSVNKGFMTVRLLSTGATVRISSEEYALHPELYVHYQKGRVKGIANFGKAPILDEHGTYRWVPKDETYKEYIRTGHWRPYNKGQLTVRDARGNSFNVASNDPRLETGEVVPTSKGMVSVVDKDGMPMQVPVDDPRYVSGELKSVNTGRVRAVTSDGRKCRVYPNDPRFGTGELKREELKSNSGMKKINVYDTEGKLYKVYPNDARLVQGQLIRKNMKSHTTV